MEIQTKPNHSPYEELLVNILENGYDHEDRTGVGRRTIVSNLTRYDVSDGTVPIPTTRQIYYKGSIIELIWFICGKTNAAELSEMGAAFWDRWSVSKEAIEAFAKKYFDDDKDLKEQDIEMLKNAIAANVLNDIGPMYGAMWRNAPNSELNALWPTVPMDEIPSDKLQQFKEEYEEIYSGVSEKERGETLEQFCSDSYYRTVDQLNELIRNLKARPYSARHVVTAWVPQFVPFETLSPEENVILGKGALSACHMSFQCFVSPPKEEGGKLRLSLEVIIRSSDVPVGLPHNTTQYAVLLHLLAHVTGMEPKDFLVKTGDTHCYYNQIENAKLQVTRDAFPFPKIRINPELKDLFQVKLEDIEIVGYQSHAKIDYNVAK